MLMNDKIIYITPPWLPIANDGEEGCGCWWIGGERQKIGKMMENNAYLIF